MGRRTRFQIAKKDIIKYFDKNPRSVFKKLELSNIFDVKHGYWRLASSMRIDDFIKELKKTSFFEEHIFSFPSKNITIYTWKELSPYLTLSELKPQSYFCYYTAMYLHNLTEQLPKEYYVSGLRASSIKKRPNQKIELIPQEAIKKAFSKKKGGSQNIAIHKNFRVYLLESSYAENIGIIKTKIENSSDVVSVTDIERTLIDITVRPFYSGGVHEVLKAYCLGAEKLSVNKLSSYLLKLDYVYPYHQLVGFYLEKTGLISEKKLEKLEKRFSIKKEMYASYGEKELLYSERWKVHYPKSMR
jgi:predicted transcriptional regulator of viral defense system